MSDDVLVKYLLGEATAEERDEVSKWIAASSANPKYFNDLKVIWDESKHLEARTTVNANEAWERFVQRAEKEDAAIAPPTTRVISMANMGWMKVAAMMVLMVGAGWLCYIMATSDEQLMAQANDTPMVQTLPDGSVVTLNKHSSISYPAKFAGKNRKVKLKGEGFFSITPDKNKPFIIDADNTAVTVVGTTFNVKCTPEQTEVIVETGIVQVAKHQHAIKVLPHQKAIVARGSDTPVMEESTDELYSYYRTKEFVCHGTPLWKLVAVLNEAYSARIVIGNKKLGDMQLSTTFHDEPLDNILKVIAETFGATIERRGGEMILK